MDEQRQEIYRKYYSVEDFYLNILTISKIDDASINSEDKAKIKRFIEYFLKIAKVII